jgi:hypothetical protein
MILEYLTELALQVPELVVHLILSLPVAIIETMPEQASPTDANTSERVGKGRPALPEFLLGRPTEAKNAKQIGGHDPSQQSGSLSFIWDREIDGV